MQRTFLVTLLISAVLLSCSTEKNKDAGAEVRLHRLNILYDSALMKHDTAFLKKIYSDDYIYTTPEGKLLNKEQQLVNIAVSELKWISGSSEDVKTKVYDDIAVMTGAFRANGTYRGSPVTILERYTAVWKKTDTSWQLIAEQGTIANPPAPNVVPDTNR